MSKNRILNSIVLSAIFALAVGTTGRAEPPDWHRVAPQGAGFSVESTGFEKRTGAPDHYLYVYGGWGLNVKVLPQDDDPWPRVDPRDRKALQQELEQVRTVILESRNADRYRDSSDGTINGYPSIRFTFDDGDSDVVMMLLVSTGERLYMVFASGQRALPDEDAKHFLDSFRLVPGRATSRF